MIIKEKFDIIVVGSGPGGSTAAYYSALEGADVVMFERHQDIGNVVRCAEGISKTGLEDFFNPLEFEGTNRVTGLTIFAPSGEFVPVKTEEIGYVLNRKVFDFVLAKKAAEKGVKIFTLANVTDLSKKDGKINGVKLNHLGKEYVIEGNIIIGADGIDSRIGKLAGLRNGFKLDEIDSCAQATIYNSSIDKHTCCVYFGNELSPGGYAWAFSKDENIANAGLGISGKCAQKKPALEYLKEFINKYFPGSSVLTMVAGGVPCAKALPKLVADNVMLVGDAAHQTNPLTGGGIANAMRAGKIAGTVAAKAIRNRDYSEKFLMQYQKEWKKSWGKRHDALYRLKKAVFRLSDEVLNSIASAVNELPPEKRDLTSIFKIALNEKPSLILDAVRVFSKKK